MRLSIFKDEKLEIERVNHELLQNYELNSVFSYYQKFIQAFTGTTQIYKQQGRQDFVLAFFLGSVVMISIVITMIILGIILILFQALLFV